MTQPILRTLTLRSFLGNTLADPLPLALRSDAGNAFAIVEVSLGDAGEERRALAHDALHEIGRHCANHDLATDFDDAVHCLRVTGHGALTEVVKAVQAMNDMEAAPQKFFATPPSPQVKVAEPQRPMTTDLDMFVRAVAGKAIEAAQTDREEMEPMLVMRLKEFLMDCNITAVAALRGQEKTLMPRLHSYLKKEHMLPLPGGLINYTVSAFIRTLKDIPARQDEPAL